MTHQSFSVHSILGERLISECLAMARYALASGRRVPPAMMQLLESYLVIDEAESTSRSTAGADLAPEGRDLQSTEKPGNDHGQMIKDLTGIHARLSAILMPATPRTVLLLDNESRRSGFWQFLGPVQLIRRMMFVAILFLIAFIVVSTSELVNAASVNEGIFASSGFELLLNLGFLFCAAGLGAAFAGLFQANRFVANGTFDPTFESSYWIRFVLGLMAGIILSELVPINIEARGTVGVLFKPLLALLGGFSAAAVYRIVSRLVDTIESLFRGDIRDQLAAREQAAEAKFEKRLSQSRIATAARLTKLQQRLTADLKPEELQEEINRIVNSLMSEGTSDHTEMDE